MIKINVSAMYIKFKIDDEDFELVLRETDFQLLGAMSRKDGQRSFRLIAEGPFDITRLDIEEELLAFVENIKKIKNANK